MSAHSKALLRRAIAIQSLHHLVRIYKSLNLSFTAIYPVPMAMHTEVREEVKYASAKRGGVLWCHTGQEGAQHLERRVLFLFHNRLLSSSINIIKYSSYCIIRKGITLLPNLSLAM